MSPLIRTLSPIVTGLVLFASPLYSQSNPRPLDPPPTRPTDPAQVRPMDQARQPPPPGAETGPTGQGTSTLETPKPLDAAAQVATLTDDQIIGVLQASNDSEIQEAKLAQKVSKNKAVQDFAQKMLAEHHKMQKDVAAIVKKAKLKKAESEPRTQAMTMAKDSLKRLRALKSVEFDRAYVDDQVAMHQATLDTVDNALVPSAQNADLKALVTQARPIIAAHLDHAKALQTSLGSQM